MMEEVSENQNLLDKIGAYYRGERISNAILVSLGITAICSTAFLFFWRQGHLSAGFFYSALPLGLFYIITGGYRFLRSIKRYQSSIDGTNSEKFLIQDEMPHLEGRIRRYLRKRNVDTIGFILGFFICVLIVICQVNHVFLGTSVSITIFSELLLVFDLFGQFRAEEYRQFLENRYSHK